jgi:hypothetical protein
MNHLISAKQATVIPAVLGYTQNWTNPRSFTVSDSTSAPAPPPTDDNGNELHPGDFYMEGPYMVFTEQYHLRRGYCCNSGCRHCPYS